MALPTVEQLLQNGPVSSAEAASAQEKIKDKATDFSADETKASDTLDAFEQVKDGIDPKIKEALDKEEKEANIEDEQETVDKSDKKDDERDKSDKDDKTDKKEVVADTQLPPTARTGKQEVAESLKGIVPDSVLPFFKKMSNDAREWVVAELKRNAKQITELKAAKTPERKEGDLPDAWYEHEDSYTLTPQFRTLAGERNQISAIEKHLREQLIAIKEGEDWFDLVPGQQPGQIVQVKRKADSASEVNVSKRIQDAAFMLQDNEQKQRAFVQQFNNGVFKHREKVKSLEDEWFPQYKDEKENEKNKHFQTVRAAFKANGLDKDRITGFTERLYAFAMDILEENEELKKGGNNSVERAAANNGPTGDDINKGETSKSRVKDPMDMPFQLKEFEKYSS